MPCTRHSGRRLAASAAVLAAAALIAALPFPTGAGAAAAPVEPCALGRVPAELRTALPRALEIEIRRFAATLRGVPAARRARAVRNFAAATAAYLYGLPPVLMRLTVARLPRNRLVGIGALATPASRAVVAQNVDTLYSVSQLDLGDGPMVIDAPATRGRYSVIQLLDAYTNVAGYVGSGRSRDRAETVAIVPPGWQGAMPSGVRVLRSPTKLVWLLGRTLVDGPDDLDAARRVVGQYRLTPLEQWRAGERLPTLVLDSFPRQPAVVVPRGIRFFDAVGAALAADPPPRRDACALRVYARAGIGPGRTPSRTARGLDARTLLAAERAGDRLVDRAVAITQRHSERRNHGWAISPSDTGRFGADYAHRAEIARVALAANTPSETIYPQTNRDSRGRPLSGAHDYVVTFPRGQLPPVRAFWSMTLYDRRLFLVPNAIDRYAVGDRTPGLRRDRDGALRIYIQHRPPRGARRANWLPSPRGRFELYLRLYEPRRAAVDGRWRPPVVTRVG